MNLIIKAFILANDTKANVMVVVNNFGLMAQFMKDIEVIIWLKV